MRAPRGGGFRGGRGGGGGGFRGGGGFGRGGRGGRSGGFRDEGPPEEVVGLYSFSFVSYNCFTFIFGLLSVWLLRKSPSRKEDMRMFFQSLHSVSSLLLPYHPGIV